MILNDNDLSVTVSKEVVRSLLNAPPDVDEDVVLDEVCVMVFYGVIYMLYCCLMGDSYR